MFETSIPDRFKKIYTAEEIRQQIDRMAAEIGVWSRETQERTKADVVCVPLMRGALYFAADLMRAIPTSVELWPVTTSSYSSSLNGSPHITVKVDMQAHEIQGKTALVIDDICDSGRTLAVLCEKLRLSGAVEVRTAVLIQREVDKKLYEPTWVGFNYSGPEWFVGYGMEDSGRWRNLSDVYRIVSNDPTQP